MTIEAPTSLGHGVGVIPLPLPFQNPRWVNCYVVVGGDGLTLIDCGLDWEPGYEALIRGFDQLGLDLPDVHTLVVSHLHPDHVGMAPRLTDDLGCRLLMHRRTSRLIDRYNDHSGFVRRIRGLLERHGVPAASLEELANVGARPGFMPQLEMPDLFVDDGDVIPLGPGRHLEVLHTPGHESAHICLRDSETGVLFSGDHLLARITPVIMFDETCDDVLADYLASMRRLVTLDVGLTYPAHGGILDRGRQRAEQILLHLDRRISNVETIAGRGPTTAWSVVGAVYRPHLTPIEQRLAMREAVSFLEHLRLTGRLRHHMDGGVSRYQRP